jgi:hypothetical protein
VGEAVRGGGEVAKRLATDTEWKHGAVAGDVDNHRHNHECNYDKMMTRRQ